MTRVHVSAGDKVKAGATLLSTKVTDAEKTMAGLKKDLASAEKDLRNLEKKAGVIRLTRGEAQWQEAWEAEAEAREAERTARVQLLSALRQAGLEMNQDALPENAGEEITALYEAWKQAQAAAGKAEKALAALDRYAIPEENWNTLQQKGKPSGRSADLEEQMTELQVLSGTAEKITAPRAAYVSQISVEKGSVVDGDTVILKLTAEGKDPVIRVDLSEVKQEVNPGSESPDRR